MSFPLVDCPEDFATFFPLQSRIDRGTRVQLPLGEGTERLQQTVPSDGIGCEVYQVSYCRF